MRCSNSKINSAYSSSSGERRNNLLCDYDGVNAEAVQANVTSKGTTAAAVHVLYGECKSGI